MYFTEIKWAIIIALVLGLGWFAYSKHRGIVELEKQAALQQYNINQLEQNLKDKDVFLQQMQDVSNHKSEIVANLYIERDALEEKLSKVQSMINGHVTAGHDRSSSQVLKDTFKALGEMK